MEKIGKLQTKGSVQMFTASVYIMYYYDYIFLFLPNNDRSYKIKIKSFYKSNSYQKYTFLHLTTSELYNILNSVIFIGFDIDIIYLKQKLNYNK